MSVSQRLLSAAASEQKEYDLSLYLAAGPALLCATLALSLQLPFNNDLILVLAASLFLIQKLRVRGWIYALSLLGIGALFKHALFLDQHLWQLGLECSLLLGLTIQTAALDLSDKQEGSLCKERTASQEKARQLNETLVKAKEELLSERTHLQEQLLALQTENTERAVELSQLALLSDVLRKNLAMAEETALRESLSQKDARAESLLAECEGLRRELARAKDASALCAENEQLFQELNAARVQREQTHLINETLARLIASHSKKSKEAESYSEELLKRLEESERERRAESEEIEERFKQRQEHLQGQINEKNEAIDHLQQRLADLSQIESTHLLLKKQFVERNEYLHQTRSELFRAQTELQAMQIEQQERLLAEGERGVVEDLICAQEGLAALDWENQRLEELVSSLLVKEPQPNSLLNFGKSSTTSDKDLRKQILQGFLKTPQKNLLFKEFPDLAEETAIRKQRAKPKLKKKPKST